MTFTVGELVRWLHVPRGGYGLAWTVDGKILEIRGERVKIEVELRTGSLVKRWVRVKNLRPREET